MTKHVTVAAPGRDDDLAAVNERVFAEAQRFRAKLPALLPAYAGRWVVFRDGEVVSDHSTDEEAYVAGLDRFGPHGGQVIALVREPEIVILDALTAFGF